jgi:hypothetical protein
MLFTSHEYVIRVTTFFQCVLLIELNAHKDEWLVAIKKLLKRKLENKKCI